MKILFLNAGYFTNITGLYKEYLLYGYRYIKNPHHSKQQFYNDFNKIMEAESPDIICMVEVKGSDIGPLIENYEYTSVRNKYGNDGQNSAAILTNIRSTFNAHYTAHGSKKLVLTTYHDHIKLACVHLSLRKKTRKQQLRQLSIEFKDYIIAGDLNTMYKHELDIFRKTHYISNLGPTFPSYDPKKELDYFLVPKYLGEDFTTRKIMSKVSDHLPIILEF